jgi:bla regulator protein BlaR1
MGASLIHGLFCASVTSSIAILLVGLLRGPLRAVVGARSAYWLWLLIPASVLAQLLPAPTKTEQIVSTSLTGYASAAFSSVTTTAITPTVSATLIVVGLIIWGTGAAVMLTQLMIRQRTFIRSLGRMTLDAHGLRRSNSIVAPMLVGAWWPQVVVPLDFETRYSSEEQRLVLAHERAHLLRRDTTANVLASGLLCLFWFNPLIYWAIARLRLDQELACDALVLAQSGIAPRRYANALLKAQLATESAWRLPVVCHWQSSHPLRERIVMLKRPLPGSSRRLGGIVIAVALSISGGYTVWAAQSVPETKSAPILLNVKLTVITEANVWSASTETLSNSGEAAAYPPGHPFDFRCTAFLPDKAGQSSAWNSQKARGVPVPVSGQILLECKLSHNGEVVSNPSLITSDGDSATVEIDDFQHESHYKLELNASTSKDKIEAERRAAAARH